jgi:cytochrome P450
VSEVEFEQQLHDISLLVVFAEFQVVRRWVGWTLVYLQRRPKIQEELCRELADPHSFDIGLSRGFNKTKNSTSLLDVFIEEAGRLHRARF